MDGGKRRRFGADEGASRARIDGIAWVIECGADDSERLDPDNAGGNTTRFVLFLARLELR